MTPADVRQVPVVLAPAHGVARPRGFALRAPLPAGVYPDAPTALRAALVAAPGWLRLLLFIDVLLGRPARRWGAYGAAPGDRLGPLRVVEAHARRVTLAGVLGGVSAHLEIHVSDGAVTAHGALGSGRPVMDRVLAGLARMLVRTILARAAGLMAARVQPSVSTFANMAEPAVANTMV